MARWRRWAAATAVVAAAVAPHLAAADCDSVVFGYESLQSGFEMPADFMPPSRQNCVALDGRAVRHGFLVTHSGGFTSCCVERGVYDAGQCALSCDNANSDFFYYGSTCYHRCFELPVDICIDAPLFVGQQATPSSVGVTALDPALNPNPQQAFLLNTGSAYVAVYAFTLGSTRRRAESTLYCSGRGPLLTDGPGDVTGCQSTPCGAPITDGFVYITGGQHCYFNCYTESTCPPGYAGSNCDQVIDNCHFTQCLNGGTCHNIIGDGTYTCECAEGFTGANCETRVEPLFCDSVETRDAFVDELAEALQGTEDYIVQKGEFHFFNIAQCAISPTCYFQNADGTTSTARREAQRVRGRGAGRRLTQSSPSACPRIFWRL